MSGGSPQVLADSRDKSALIHHDSRKLTSLFMHMTIEMLVG